MRSMTWIAVAVGGALGSVARFGVQVALERGYGRSMPYATAIVNATGCVIIGALAGALSAQRFEAGEEWRAFVFVGLLGGFTTFSSFGLDTWTLLQEGRRATALMNVAGQVAIGMLGVAAGYTLAARS